MKTSLIAILCVATWMLTNATASAEIKTCTYEKQILRSTERDTDEDCKDFYGESFKIDTTKHRLYVRWPRGASGWFTPDKVTRNSSFTSYILYRDLEISTFESSAPKKSRLCTITYRLYADGKRAEAHQIIPNHKPRAARYTCK